MKKNDKIALNFAQQQLTYHQKHIFIYYLLDTMSIKKSNYTAQLMLDEMLTMGKIGHDCKPKEPWDSNSEFKHMMTHNNMPRD